MSESGKMKRTRSRMLARRWSIAKSFRDPSDYGIPEAPTAEVDGETFIEAENTMKVRR